MEKVEKSILGFVIVGIIISIVIAVFISPLASSFPDGLEKVAESFGFIDKATTAVNESFFIIPDYEFKYVSGEQWQGPLAGLFGVLIILVIFGIIFLIYRSVSKNKQKKSGLNNNPKVLINRNNV
jgi:cobalt/nickel transport protein